MPDFIFVYNCKKNIGIPISLQLLWLILLETWWWPVNRSKHVAYCSNKYLLCWRILVNLLYTSSPVPIAARSKALVWGRQPAETVGSNPTGGMDVCLLRVLWVVRWRSLPRTDHSSRGVLLTVVRHCVWSRNLVNEETLAHWGLSRQINNNNKLTQVLIITYGIIIKSISTVWISKTN